MKICLEKTAVLFRVLSGLAIFVGGYVFLSEIESIFTLAGTQWILIAIMFGILAINTSLMSGNRSLLDDSDSECECGKCDCEKK
jgi:hypothetical protein